MRYALLSLTLIGCTSNDPVLSSDEQAEWDGGSDDPEGEVIVVEGGIDGWPDWWFPGPGEPVDPGDTGDGYGGGGPGPGGGEVDPQADPHPIPAPKDCTQETTHEGCMSCCNWNVDNVWGARCKRLPRNERRVCWEEAEKRRGDCQRDCPGPEGGIITITVMP